MKFELRHAVFPIVPLRPHDDGPPRVYCDPADLGSVFFITTNGVFLTAKHVVNGYSVDSYAVLAMNLRVKGYKECRVQALERHPNFDIAIGLAEEPGPDGWPHPFTVAGGRIGDRAAVLLYGYAKTLVTPRRDLGAPVRLDDALTLDFQPRQYSGHVVEYMERAPLLAGHWQGRAIMCPVTLVVASAEDL